MPGIEIKGRSKIATYRHGGRVGLTHGGQHFLTKKPKKTSYITKKEKPKKWITKKDRSTQGKDIPTMAAKGGRIGLKKGNDVPHGLTEVKRKKWYEPGIGINVATGQRKKPDLGGKLPEDIKAKTDKPGFSAGYTWNPDYRPKGKRLEQVADKGVYVHKAPTKDRKQDKTWKTRQKETKLELKKETEKKKRFEDAKERTKQRKKGNY